MAKDKKIRRPKPASLRQAGRQMEIIRLMEQRVKGELAKPDTKLVVAVHTRDQLVSVINYLYERLEEWCTTLDIPIRGQNIKEYVQNGLNYLNGVKQGEVKNDSIKGEDLEVILQLFEMSYELIIYKDKIEKYIESLAEKVCPNVTAIVGPELAAELVTLAGGIERMASFPAGTVQVLGAEKALFRHLKTGAKPPKYGILYKHPKIIHAPKNKKGKIARIIATHVSIASRADAFTKRPIWQELKNDLEKKIEKILKE